MTNSMNPIEPAAKALAATALSQSLSFCMERKYLEGIGVSSCENPFHLEAIDCTVKDEAQAGGKTVARFCRGLFYRHSKDTLFVFLAQYHPTSVSIGR